MHRQKERENTGCAIAPGISIIIKNLDFAGFLLLQLS